MSIFLHHHSIAWEFLTIYFKVATKGITSPAIFKIINTFKSYFFNCSIIHLNIGFHRFLINGYGANDGLLKNPKLITEIKTPNSSENLWDIARVEKRVMTPKVAEEMRSMMMATIEEGTARKQFRKMNRGFKEVLEIGGKTGSITGGKPFGKRDWFTAYAMPKDHTKGKGISVSVMNVNVKRWHVKSSFLAKNVIEYYFRNIKITY